jgi:hypothetical protein
LNEEQERNFFLALLLLFFWTFIFVPWRVEIFVPGGFGGEKAGFSRLRQKEVRVEAAALLLFLLFLPKLQLGRCQGLLDWEECSLLCEAAEEMAQTE